ncbi:MAG: N-acetyl-gamma-glutamyl-phosphate reductase [Anaerolineae bacterium]|nr:MAG: N-acetyl-gamma-glutamyl-phosphate reductase [Anaerolineae bacterium]
MIEVGVLGATGYTGAELIRLIGRHEQVRLAFATSRSNPDRSLAQVFPGAPEVDLIAPEHAPLKDVDLVFLCLAHGQSAEVAAAALQAGTRVIDLSADFRLADADTYQQWYGQPHAAPELLDEAVYGLTEIAREQLSGARLVANPGCYPTTVLLALYPLLLGSAVSGQVIVDAKSGVSGAGRTPKLATHFVEVAGDLRPYSIGRTHRHLPEMEAMIALWGDSHPKLIFSPHLVPIPRGLLSTLYVPLRSGWVESQLHELYLETYADEPFITILPVGEVATLRQVNYSNRCVIGMTEVEGTLVVTAAIDNLQKGAAGQALQNMNVVFGLEETAGLL